MKTLFLFLLSCFISSGAMLAAASLHNSIIGFSVAGLTWLLFVKYIGRKKKGYRYR
jgi:multisubunit Na+/H+ antiporter MnhC subunit